MGSEMCIRDRFVNWVVFLFNEIWEQKVAKMKETLMIVDGHVGFVELDCWRKYCMRRGDLTLFRRVK